MGFVIRTTVALALAVLLGATLWEVTPQTAAARMAELARDVPGHIQPAIPPSRLDRIGDRCERFGDRLERRVERAGDRVGQRLDRISDRIAERGARHLERVGQHLERLGERLTRD